MKEVTATELQDWMSFLEEEEIRDWERPSKQDYYLARIAFEINRILEALCDVKDRKGLKEFLFEYDRGKENPNAPSTVPYNSAPSRPAAIDPYNLKPGDEYIIPGETPLNEKWQKRCDDAKVMASAWFGVNLLEMGNEQRAGT